MTNSESAKRVAQENLRLDPMFYKRKGSIGGSVKGIKKGHSAMDKQRSDEIRAKANEALRLNREKKDNEKQA